MKVGKVDGQTVDVKLLLDNYFTKSISKKSSACKRMKSLKHMSNKNKAYTVQTALKIRKMYIFFE